MFFFFHLNYRKLIQDYSCKVIKIVSNTGVCSIGRSVLTFIINIREAISFYSTVCLKEVNLVQFLIGLPFSRQGNFYFHDLITQANIQTPLRKRSAALEESRHCRSLVILSCTSVRVPKSHGMISEHNSRRGSVSTKSQVLAHYELTYFKT